MWFVFVNVPWRRIIQGCFADPMKQNYHTPKYMKSTPVINKITNNIKLEEYDEFIDTQKYTIDVRELILSDQTMCEIMRSYSNTKSQKILLTAAFKSLRTNNMLEFRRIICEQKDIVNTKYEGTYLIHEACRLGNADFVCLLLFLGAKCNIMDDKGLMAQHYAIIGRDPMCVDILFLFGNHMDVKDMYGNTPYEYMTKKYEPSDNDEIGKKNNKIEKNKKVTFLSSNDLQKIINQYEVKDESESSLDNSSHDDSSHDDD